MTAVLKALALATLLLITVVPSHGATIVVAKDGTGDFSVLFDALEAAADGDTVRIRAGEYDDLRGPFANDIYTLGIVRQSSLTIIGDGADVVFIGPTEPPTGLRVNGLDSGIESGTIWLSGVTIRNTTVRGLDFIGDGAIVRDVRLIGDLGLALASSCRISTVIERVHVEGPGDGVAIFSSQGAIQAFVRDSSFQTQGSIGLSSGSRILEVDGCTFAGSGVGLSVEPGVEASITECRFRDHTRAIDVFSGAIADISGCRTEPGVAISLDMKGTARMVTGNEFLGGTFATVRLSTPDAVPTVFSGNHIINDGGWSVLAQRGTPPVQGVLDYDLSGNYWGTSDEFQIVDWIYDIRDDETNYIRVEWRPIESGPVSTETTSFGGLKSRFND